MRKVVLRAWLLASLCIMFGILFAAPAAADEEKDWEEAGYAQITVNTALRSQKNTKTLSSIVKIAKKGQIVEITDDAGGGWYKVSIGSKSGYLHSDFFTDEDDEDLTDNIVTRVTAVDLTLRSSPKVTSENSEGVLRAGTTVTILGERSDNWVRVAYTVDDEYEDAYIRNGFFTTDPKTGKGYSWRTAVQNLFIRSSASASSTNVVGTLKKGKKVKVIGVSGNRYKVRYKGSVRYVKEGYFSNEANTDYVQETVASRINFRSSAKIKQDNVIKVLNPGTAVKVLKSVSKTWYKVKVGSTTGYLLAGYFVSDVEEDDPDSGSSTVIRMTTSALRMRTGRGTDYDVITVIPKGSIVTLSIQYGSWYKVRYTDDDGNEYAGWVDGTYLTET